MHIGLHLPSALPGASAEGILAVARAAERLGFDGVWMFDHLFTPVKLESRYPYGKGGAYPFTADVPFFDPLALFGVLAGATARIHIGTGVMIAACRHPLVVAKAIASIERFAPGRILLGLGSGWMKEEFDAVGVPFAGRGERFDEYLQALRAAWSGEPRGFAGKHYAWPAAGLFPVPSAPIPLVVGGHGDAALRRAARHGDGWAIAMGPGQGSGLDAVAARLEVLRRMLAEEGRDPARFLLLFQNLLAFADGPHPKLPFVGPPGAIAASLDRLAALGVTHVDLMVFGGATEVIDSAERFAREVRPLVPSR